MSISMFSTIPVPNPDWEDDSLKFILLFLPFVGFIIASLWIGVQYILFYLNFNELLKAFLITLTPFILTGFLHIDGFCDTCDALFSGRDLDKKRKILKDPNLGVFGGCALIFVILLWFICSLDINNSLLLIPMCIASRAVAALSVMNLRSMNENGLGALFKKHVKNQNKYNSLLIIILIISLAISSCIKGMQGLTFIAMIILISGISAFSAYKNFQGFSGDLAGFSIVCGESVGLILLSL